MILYKFQVTYIQVTNLLLYLHTTSTSQYTAIFTLQIKISNYGNLYPQIVYPAYPAQPDKHRPAKQTTTQFHRQPPGSRQPAQNATKHGTAKTDADETDRNQYD